MTIQLFAMVSDSFIIGKNNARFPLTNEFVLLLIDSVQNTK